MLVISEYGIFSNNYQIANWNPSKSYSRLFLNIYFIAPYQIIQPGTSCSDQNSDEVLSNGECKKAGELLGLKRNETIYAEDNFPGCQSTNTIGVDKPDYAAICKKHLGSNSK